MYVDKGNLKHGQIVYHAVEMLEELPRDTEKVKEKLDDISTAAVVIRADGKWATVSLDARFVGNTSCIHAVEVTANVDLFTSQFAAIRAYVRGERKFIDKHSSELDLIEAYLGRHVP